MLCESSYHVNDIMPMKIVPRRPLQVPLQPMGEPMKLPTPAPLTTGPCPWVADSWKIPVKDGAPPLQGRTMLAAIAKSFEKTSKAGEDEDDSTSCGTSEADSSEPGSQIDSGVEELASQDADLLGTLSFFQRASLILPAISGCAQLLGMTKSLRSIEQLKRQIAEHPATRKQAKTALTLGMTMLLRNSMKHLQVEDLMKMMKPEEAPPSVQLSLETLFYEMEQEQQKQKGSNVKHGPKRKQVSRRSAVA